MFEIGWNKFQIGKSPQMIPQDVELFEGAQTREKFLTDRADHLNSEFGDQLTQLQNKRILNHPVASQCQGPDAGIDQDLHVFFRCSL